MSLPERLMEVEAGEVRAVRRAPAGTTKSFRPYAPGQVLLMAPDAREWVPDGDLAHFVDDLVEDVLDLSVIYGAYVEERGFFALRPAADEQAAHLRLRDRDHVVAQAGDRDVS
jgi:hypothetical protein